MQSSEFAPFLIIQTGKPVASLRRYGSFPDWIRTAAGLSRHQTVVIDVQNGESLPDTAEGFAGVLITGSGAMVSEREPWSEATAAWLKKAAAAGAPMFGICYGHQLLAHALGGEVGDNPNGREMGTITLHLNASASTDALFAGASTHMRVHATHLQTVLKPPAEAIVLATSALDACQAFRWKSHVWGVQFHPEFSTNAMRGYVKARTQVLIEEKQDPAQLLQHVMPTPDARLLLRRFVHHAQHSLRTPS